MTKRYRIGILICTLLICLMYWAEYRYVQKQQNIQIEDSAEEVPAKMVAGQADQRVYRYYLLEDDGYVSVYLDDRVTLYETTSIAVKQLPGSIQKEIQSGKPIENEHELYNFLENYSS